jgi:hypothetical protein
MKIYSLSIFVGHIRIQPIKINADPSPHTDFSPVLLAKKNITINMG